MTRRTGPAEVGLETVVLPAHLMVTPPEMTVFVLAPTCRYGRASYGIYFCREGVLPGSTDRLNWRESVWTVQSGASVRVPIPLGWEDAEIRLWLQAMKVDPGAFTGVAPGVWADALAHALQEVREQALLDMADKSAYESADAAEDVTQKEKRERGQ